MALYTRSGDGGDTDSGGGRRVRKHDARVTALGELDELNAHVGLCLWSAQAAENRQLVEMLDPLQGELMTAAAVLSGSPAGARVRLDAAAVKHLEGQIDAAWEKLPAPQGLVLPGGYELACRLHIARAVCRRAERALVALADAGGGVPAEVLAYVNRLGDLLFALARLANKDAGIDERPWKPSK